ncbi:MAG: DUF1178 family protein [Paracoccaceae bacterium]
MIKFSLNCGKEHGFDSWFGSAADFDQLERAGLLACPICGDSAVVKAIMAPGVRTSRAAANPRGAPTTPEADDAAPGHKQMHALSTPSSPAEAAMQELKKKIQEHSEYVGTGFASEARAIHDGDAPERSIYGEANAREARALIEDGVPVAPLPFLPSRKAN